MSFAFGLFSSAYNVVWPWMAIVLGIKAVSLAFQNFGEAAEAASQHSGPLSLGDGLKAILKGKEGSDEQKPVPEAPAVTPAESAIYGKNLTAFDYKLSQIDGWLRDKCKTARNDPKAGAEYIYRVAKDNTGEEAFLLKDKKEMLKSITVAIKSAAEVMRKKYQKHPTHKETEQFTRVGVMEDLAVELAKELDNLKHMTCDTMGRVADIRKGICLLWGSTAPAISTAYTLNTESKRLKFFTGSADLQRTRDQFVGYNDLILEQITKLIAAVNETAQAFNASISKVPPSSSGSSSSGGSYGSGAGGLKHNIADTIRALADELAFARDPANAPLPARAAEYIELYVENKENSPISKAHYKKVKLKEYLNKTFGKSEDNLNIRFVNAVASLGGKPIQATAADMHSFILRLEVSIGYYEKIQATAKKIWDDKVLTVAGVDNAAKFAAARPGLVGGDKDIIDKLLDLPEYTNYLTSLDGLGRSLGQFDTWHKTPEGKTHFK